eukprot:GEMP01040642.1.p1 GENE.GEMP01040642.1~~GEMP01040642.1.p1  ORF type:complete len:212 (-),score=33.27 GEMP01040642.1:1200-1835(-)
MSVETSILLLPETNLAPDTFTQTCRNTLLRVSGCISVAIHAFEGLPSADQSAQRWYAVVTFQRHKTTSDKLKQVLQNEFLEAPRELNVGMLRKMEKLNAPPSPRSGTVDRDNASYYALSTCSDNDEATDTNDMDALEALDWWGLGDEVCNSRSSQTFTASSEPDSGYLAESAGTQRAVLSFMAPLVGVFGYNRAQQFNEKYTAAWSLAQHE